MVDKAFRHLLKDKRDAIAAQWRDLVLATYPKDAAKFMGSNSDPFSNPVGQTFSRCLGPILDQLIEASDEEKITPLINDMMRVRAVQQFLPSTAVGFFLHLKNVVRGQLKTSSLDADQLRDLLNFEARVDEVMLKAFDEYLGCREKLYEIKATELRRRSERVITKLNERILARHQSDGAEEHDSSHPNSERGGTK